MDAFDSMIICGNIYVARDIKAFLLKCIYCDIHVENYPEFIQHIQRFHNPLSESWMDPLIDDAKEDVLSDDIKEEFLNVDIIKEESNIAASIKEDHEVAKLEDSANESDNEDIDLKICSSKTNNEQKEGENNKNRTVKFNLTLYRRNDQTTKFIEIYEKYPCLWHPNDKDYRNFPLREEALKKIADTMHKKCNIMFTEVTLKSTIKKLHKQYFTIQQQQKEQNTTRKTSTVIQDYIRQCSFLGVLTENPEDMGHKRGNINHLMFWKENDLTNAFIDTFACFPCLYDPNDSDYANFTNRKKAYNDIISCLKTEHNIIFTLDDFYKGMYGLRQWYYRVQDRCKKSSNANSLSEIEALYMKRCDFLPPKIPKLKLPCEICGQVSLNETSLQVHMYKKHQVGELPHKCTNCERSFEQRSALLVHQQRNHVGKVYQCDYCERRFAVQVDLRRHIKTHTGERPFVCELCGKAFPRRTQLKYHKDAVHTKTRAFKCTMCPKDFLKRGDLNDHIKAHLNIRDKICETCGKGFTNCHSLIRHRQIHSEVKKFACKLCEARFHQFVGLNAHMKRTHNIVKNKANS